MADLIASILLLLPMLAFIIAALTNSAMEIDAADLENSPSRLAFTLSNIAGELGAMLTGMLLVTFLSLAYRHFRGLPEPENISATATAP